MIKKSIATAVVCGVSLFGFTAVAGADAVTFKPAPIARFTVTTGGWIGRFCGFWASFNAQSSSAPAGTSITQYAWNLGSGPFVKTSPYMSLLLRPGSYDVTLTVTDSDGASASTSRIVSAGDLTWPFHC